MRCLTFHVPYNLVAFQPSSDLCFLSLTLVVSFIFCDLLACLWSTCGPHTSCLHDLWCCICLLRVRPLCAGYNLPYLPDPPTPLTLSILITSWLLYLCLLVLSPDLHVNVLSTTHVFACPSCQAICLALLSITRLFFLY